MKRQLASFLMRKRIECGITYAKFSQETGFSPSVLHRLEHGKQSITIDKLAQILTKLKVKLSDIFPE
jgi:transcriptional regulator with XRE-family HTH domain